jgi:Zn-dependent peptidase ImmA (M78 family)
VIRPNDYSLTEERREAVRKHAKRALTRADALGSIPVPIADVIEAAKLIVAEEHLEEDGLIAEFRRKAKRAGHTLRRALSKVLGVLDSAARVIYLDRTVHVARRAFLKLHETGHAVLPWQAKIFAITEDCEKTLAPEVADEFEREANTFAAEVIFQLDAFTEEANQHAFNILVPVKLSRRYGASIYMSIRRYVTENHRACAVLVLEPPKYCEGGGFVADFRREVVSPSFREKFGKLDWPSSFGPADELGRLVPIGGRKMSCPREITLVDRNRARHRCMAEAFTQGHQVFILIHAASTLNSRVAV